MGHLGLTPQSIYKFGTYTVRAKEESEAQKLLENAQLLQELGCLLVPEKIPRLWLSKSLAESLLFRLSVLAPAPMLTGRC